MNKRDVERAILGLSRDGSSPYSRLGGPYGTSEQVSLWPAPHQRHRLAVVSPGRVRLVHGPNSRPGSRVPTMSVMLHGFDAPKADRLITVTRQMDGDPRSQWIVEDGDNVSSWDNEKAVKEYLKALGVSNVEWRKESE